ncbi:hypothetical protein BHM03_00024102 [Ensete ventricosum]|nr:hypothetical protein BHM03_00024102 [Ensete ventricosum]
MSHKTASGRNLNCSAIIHYAGRVRYKFASFWNRNHTLRALQRTDKNFHASIEAEKKLHLLWLFDLKTQERAHSSSVIGRGIEVPNESVVETGKFQAFINEDVLVGIVNVFETVQQVHDILFGSNFEVRNSRFQPSSVAVGRQWSISTVDSRFWAVSTEGGRKKKRGKKYLESMLLFAHAIHRLRDPLPLGNFFSPRGEKKRLPPWGEGTRRHVIYIVFQVHCRWLMNTISDCSCTIDIRVGKLLYKKEVAQMLEIARSYLGKAGSSHEKVETSETALALS